MLIRQKVMQSVQIMKFVKTTQMTTQNDIQRLPKNKYRHANHMPKTLKIA